MKVAIVHDQLNEFGGAERVLLALSEMYPDAPIYTAYCVKGSPAWKRFKGKDIRVSWMQYVYKLSSPLRFLAPLIWNTFDFTNYDLIIGSSSWYVTKGFGRKRLETGDKRLETRDRGQETGDKEQVAGNKKQGTRSRGNGETVEICYCHTPPRWLYGYPTSVNWQKYPIVRLYATVVGFFMRQYDFNASQRVDYFIANSKETQRRIEKFYRRESVVIYPPTTINSKFQIPTFKIQDPRSKIQNLTSNLKTLNSKLEQAPYYLFVSRPVGSKGLEIAIGAAKKLGFPLKIVGRTGKRDGSIEFLGLVSDDELELLYRDAKAFFALATDEDFGMTPVESMALGTPVIAYNGGGYPESVIDKKTGILFNDASVDGLVTAIKTFESIKKDWTKDCLAQAQKFSTERFVHQINDFIDKTR